LSLLEAGEKMKAILYHGGDKEMPSNEINFPGPRPDCDFGAGFYCTPNRKIAEEWVRNKQSPVISMYELEYNDALHIKEETWLKTVLGYREQLYKVTISANIIIGAIADDRMNDALPAFTTDAVFSIGDKRLFECLTLVNLGDQYVLKNNAQGLTFLKSYTLTPQALQQAQARHGTRRRDMQTKLKQIHRKQYANEKFLEDYIRECKDGFTI
jgi:hypothetical protein